MISTQNIFHTPKFSDDPSSFISESENISGRDLWYTWPENRLVDSWKFVAPAPPAMKSQITSTLSLQAIILTLMKSKYWTEIPAGLKEESRGDLYQRQQAYAQQGRGPLQLPGVYESILMSSEPKVATWDILTLADERRRIVRKFRGMENILCWDQMYWALHQEIFTLVCIHVHGEW